MKFGMNNKEPPENQRVKFWCEIWVYIKVAVTTTTPSQLFLLFQTPFFFSFSFLCDYCLFNSINPSRQVPFWHCLQAIPTFASTAKLLSAVYSLRLFFTKTAESSRCRCPGLVLLLRLWQPFFSPIKALPNPSGLPFSLTPRHTKTYQELYHTNKRTTLTKAKQFIYNEIHEFGHLPRTSCTTGACHRHGLHFYVLH